VKPLPPLELTPEDLTVATHVCRRLIKRNGTAIRWLRTTTVADRRDAELMRVLLLCFAQRAPVPAGCPAHHSNLTRQLILAHATLPQGYPLTYDSTRRVDRG
jgi:hypothetical protein